MLLFEQTYYSTGGGFIATEKQLRTPAPKDIITTGRKVPFPFGSAAELLEHARAKARSIEEIIYANEDAMRPREETDARLDRVAQVMSACIDRGLHKEGIPAGRACR
jgi:L-serine dehydratase